MSIAQLLNRGLPSDFERKSDGGIDVYRLAGRLNLKPQTIYEWLRKDRVRLKVVELLIRIDGASFRLEDFIPYCPEVSTVLALQNGEVVREN